MGDKNNYTVYFGLVYGCVRKGFVQPLTKFSSPNKINICKHIMLCNIDIVIIFLKLFQMIVNFFFFLTQFVLFILLFSLFIFIAILFLYPLKIH